MQIFPAKANKFAGFQFKPLILFEWIDVFFLDLSDSSVSD